MNSFQNEDGEYLMTAAELRFEAALDEQSVFEQYADDFYNDFEGPEIDPEDCDHPDFTYKGDGTTECDLCYSVFGRWEGRDEDGWPILVP